VERAEVKEFEKRERYKKLFKHATSPKSLAPVNYAFRKSCIHTQYKHISLYSPYALLHLLGTLLAVTGSVHLVPRLLVN
jgi:hypothetical protein